MKCPVCVSTELQMTDRQGVEIDYCPQCRGVWLDRGELDKILERSSQHQGVGQTPPNGYRQDDDDDDRYRNDPRGRRRGWLFDIFD